MQRKKTVVIITTRALPYACYLARKVRSDDVEIHIVNQLAMRVPVRSWAYYQRLLRRRGLWVFFDNLLDEVIVRFNRSYPVRGFRKLARTVMAIAMRGQTGPLQALQLPSFPALRPDPELRYEPWLRWVDVDDINSDAVRAMLTSLAPDLVLLCGSPILSSHTIAVAGKACLNAHCGITPQYGGWSPIDWALFRRDWSKIGFTIHYVTAQVDGGPVIYQETVSWRPTWSVYHIRHFVMQSMHDKYAEVALQMLGEQRPEAREQQEVTVLPPAGAITRFLAEHRKRRYARSMNSIIFSDHA